MASRLSLCCRLLPGSPAGPHVGGLQAGSRVLLAEASAGCSVQPLAAVVQHKHRLHKVVVCQQRRLYRCGQSPQPKP